MREINSIGFPYQRPFWQGAQPHGNLFVGEGQKTFARVGCVVCSVAMALRHLGARAGATPLDVNKVGKDNFAFAKDSASAFVRKLIDCQKGIVSQFEIYAIKEDPQRVSELITGTLAGEGVVLCHVDYNGNDIGDHWVLIFRQEDEEFVADDSAIGTHIRFDSKTLKADVLWKDQPKTYEIKRIIPIKRES